VPRPPQRGNGARRILFRGNRTGSISDVLQDGSWPGGDVAGLYDDGGIAYGPFEKGRRDGLLFPPSACPVPD